MKRSRILAVAFAVIYLALAGAATVYSQSTYSSNLPTAYFAVPSREQIDYDSSNPDYIKPEEDGKYADALPRTCIYDDGTGQLKVNMVAEEDGPWGKRYKIKQTQAACWPVNSDSKYVLVLWRMDDSLPIAADIDSEYVYDGMEVKLDYYKDK